MSIGDDVSGAPAAAVALAVARRGGRGRADGPASIIAVGGGYFVIGVFRMSSRDERWVGRRGVIGDCWFGISLI